MSRVDDNPPGDENCSKSRGIVVMSVSTLLISLIIGVMALIIRLEHQRTSIKSDARIGTVEGPEEDNLSVMPKFDDAHAETPLSSLNVIDCYDKTIHDILMGLEKLGTGKGGTGFDSARARARSLRWVIAFNTRGGQDYLDQLQDLGAVIFVPIPGESNKFMTYANLTNPGKGEKVGLEEVAKHIAKMQFHEFRREPIREVSESFELNFKLKWFIAFFPKTFEDDLANKEIGYQQRRSADIEETKFQVVRRAGNYEIHVTGQTLKK